MKLGFYDLALDLFVPGSTYVREIAHYRSVFYVFYDL